MKKDSQTISNGIRIKVEPLYIPPDLHNQDKNLFSYKVTITNEGDEYAKLISRHWVIIDADGNKDEVKGPGVVGQTPGLNPGDSFTYTSYCPIDTDWGTMEGSYKMERSDGSRFDAIIARFYLIKE